MRALNLPVPTDGTPLYRRLARAVRRAVQEGQVRPGELLPSTRQLGHMCGAHRHTVMAALDELVAEGWLVAEAGRGYRVISALPGDPADLPATAPAREEGAWRLVREVNDSRPRPDPAPALRLPQRAARPAPVPHRRLLFVRQGGAPRAPPPTRCWDTRMRAAPSRCWSNLQCTCGACGALDAARLW